jgi:hypothetical protein
LKDAFLSFVYSEDYGRRCHSILSKIILSPEFRDGAPAASEAVAVLANLVCELAHAASTGVPHILTLLPTAYQ